VKHVTSACHLQVEDGGAMFLLNISWISTEYRRYIAEDRTLHNHRYENLKSYKISAFPWSIFKITNMYILYSSLSIMYVTN
jgi:hypothetical protein